MVRTLSFHCRGVRVCLITQSCLILCNPMDCSPPGFSVHGIILATTLEQVAVSSFSGSSWPRDWIHISCVYCIGRQILYHWATWEDPTAEDVSEFSLWLGPKILQAMWLSQKTNKQMKKKPLTVLLCLQHTHQSDSVKHRCDHPVPQYPPLYTVIVLKSCSLGTSLMVQWLGLLTSSATGQRFKP